MLLSSSVHVLTLNTALLHTVCIGKCWWGGVCSAVTVKHSISRWSEQHSRLTINSCLSPAKSTENFQYLLLIGRCRILYSLNVFPFVV